MYWVIFLFTGLPSSLSSNERGVGKRSHDQLDYQSSGSEHHPRSGQYRALIGGGGGIPSLGVLLKLLGQSPWSMAMCLVWQSVLLGNG